MFVLKRSMETLSPVCFPVIIRYSTRVEVNDHLTLNFD